MCIRERADVAFNQAFAPGVGSLGVRCRILVALASVLGRTVDTAGRGINKPRDATLLACPRQGDRAEMVDLVCCAFVLFTERISG